MEELLNRLREVPIGHRIVSTCLAGRTAEETRSFLQGEIDAKIPDFTFDVSVYPYGIAIERTQ